MTHADRIREAERAVVEAAVAQEYKARSVINVLREPLGRNHDFIGFCCQTHNAVSALLAAREETCAACGGTGKKLALTADEESHGEWEDETGCVVVPCPAGCDAGKRRTT